MVYLRVVSFCSLTPSVCYDAKVQDHCKLLDIHEDCGAVEVCYADDPDKEHVISPDNLVHVPNVPWEDCVTVTKKPSPKTKTNCSSRNDECEKKNKVYFGVFVSV